MIFREATTLQYVIAWLELGWEVSRLDIIVMILEGERGIGIIVIWMINKVGSNDSLFPFGAFLHSSFIV
jgi:hypothetical protein